ncbi:hypothetical protein ACIGO8_17825 [Streptomyces sp. NPDC053493]|uniref:hypothetical protein n=1 Tax=Streptomyces sp. NPDC053493 TaxID=3365705 RepID=UPI0037D3678D
MRLRSIRAAAATAGALLLTLAGTAFTAAPASAVSGDFTYEVTRNADTYLDVPGTEITFDAAAGQRSFLWSRYFSTGPVDAVTAGDNIGNTMAIRCRNADGTALPAGTEAGAYWAANLVPPGEKQLTAALRWVFQAPADGSYSCRLSIVSYSSIIVNGRTVTMRVPAGAELARKDYAATADWTLQAGSGTVVSRSTTPTTTLGYTYTPSPTDTDFVVYQDAALSTCAAGSSICPGGTTAYTGTVVDTWVEAQPRKTDGTPCGSPLTGAVSRWNITNDKHHQTAANHVHLTTAQLPAGCTQVRATLKVRNVDGNPVKIHDGYASGTIAATHGAGISYSTAS